MRKIQVIENTTIEPLWVQIEDWADLLYLLPNEKLALVIYAEDPMDETNLGKPTWEKTNLGHP